MGVPLTFLDKYDPEQFEIIQFRKGNDGRDLCYIRERAGNSLLQDNHTQEDIVNYICETYGYVRSEMDVCSGVMGVPISFLDKYNPDQFELLGLTASADTMDKPVQLGERFMELYRSQGGSGHFSANMYGVCYVDYNGKAKVPYGRLLVRHS